MDLTELLQRAEAGNEDAVDRLRQLVDSWDIGKQRAPDDLKRASTAAITAIRGAYAPQEGLPGPSSLAVKWIELMKAIVPLSAKASIDSLSEVCAAALDSLHVEREDRALAAIQLFDRSLRYRSAASPDEARKAFELFCSMVYKRSEIARSQRDALAEYTRLQQQLHLLNQEHSSSHGELHQQHHQIEQSSSPSAPSPNQPSRYEQQQQQQQQQTSWLSEQAKKLQQQMRESAPIGVNSFRVLDQLATVLASLLQKKPEASKPQVGILASSCISLANAGSESQVTPERGGDGGDDSGLLELEQRVHNENVGASESIIRSGNAQNDESNEDQQQGSQRALPESRIGASAARAVHTLLKTVQIRCISLLAQILCFSSKEPLRYSDALGDACVHLMETLYDSSYTRRELLQAVRSLLQQSMSPESGTHALQLQRFVDSGRLLNEKALVGTAKAVPHAVRSTAYQVLLELLYYTRCTLDRKQLFQLAGLLSRSLHLSEDAQIHAYIAKHMQTLGDSAMNLHRSLAKNTAKDGYDCLELLLESLVSRVESVKLQYAHAACSGGGNSSNGEVSKEVHHQRGVLRHLLAAIAKLSYVAKSRNPSADAADSEQKQASQPCTSTQVASLVSTAILHSLKVLVCLPESEPSHREVAQHMLLLLSSLDEFSMRDVLVERVPDIVGSIVNDGYSCPLTFVHMMLTDKANSPHWKSAAEILLDHVTKERLDALNSEPRCSSNQTVVKLMQQLLNSISSVEGGDEILRPHLVQLVDKCIRGIVSVRDPTGYARVLRYVFRAVDAQSSKFNQLHCDLQPCVAPCFEVFLEALRGPVSSQLRGMIVELCLILPMRKAMVLPEMRSIIKPLTEALEAETPDLRNVALHCLEGYIDSSKSDLLDQMLATHDSESRIVRDLWSLVKPTHGAARQGVPTHSMGEKALSLLGKLGGRARRAISGPQALDSKSNSEIGMRAVLKFKPVSESATPARFVMPLDKTAAETTSMAFIRTALTPLLGLDIAADRLRYTASIAAAIRNGGADAEQLQKSYVESHECASVKTRSLLQAERSAILSLLTRCLAAGESTISNSKHSLPTFSSQSHHGTTPVASATALDEDDDAVARPFARHLCGHFALLFALGLSDACLPLQEPATASAKNKLTTVHPILFLEALARSLSGPSEAGADSLRTFIRYLRTIADSRGSDDGEQPQNIADRLVRECIHMCFQTEWPAMLGGVRAVSVIASEGSTSLVQSHSISMVKASLQVLRDLPSDAIMQQEAAQDALDKVIERFGSVDDQNSPKFELLHAIAIESIGIMGPGWQHAQLAARSALARCAAKCGYGEANVGQLLTALNVWIRQNLSEHAQQRQSWQQRQQHQRDHSDDRQRHQTSQQRSAADPQQVRHGSPAATGESQLTLDECIKQLEYRPALRWREHSARRACVSVVRYFLLDVHEHSLLKLQEPQTLSFLAECAHVATEGISSSVYEQVRRQKQSQSNHAQQLSAAGNESLISGDESFQATRLQSSSVGRPAKVAQQMKIVDESPVQTETELLRAECVQLLAQTLPEVCREIRCRKSELHDERQQEPKDEQQTSMNDLLCDYLTYCADAFGVCLFSPHLSVAQWAEEGLMAMPKDELFNAEPFPSSDHWLHFNDAVSPSKVAARSVSNRLPEKSHPSPMGMHGLARALRVFHARENELNPSERQNSFAEQMSKQVWTVLETCVSKPEVAAAALRCLVHLPSWAAHAPRCNAMLAEVFQRTAQLEQDMPSAPRKTMLQSPYRTSLLELMRKSDESIPNFVQNALEDSSKNGAVAHIVLSVLERSDATDVTERLLTDTASTEDGNILERMLDPADSDESDLSRLRGARLAALLVARHGYRAISPRSQEEQKLLDRWSSNATRQRRAKPHLCTRAALEEPAYLGRALSAYVMSARGEAPTALLRLVGSLAFPSIPVGGSSFVKDLVDEHVPRNWSVDDQKKLVRESLSSISSRLQTPAASVSQDGDAIDFDSAAATQRDDVQDTQQRSEVEAVITQELRHVVRPIIDSAAWKADQEDGVLDNEIVELVSTELFSNHVRGAGDELVMEALNVSTDIFKHKPQAMGGNNEHKQAVSFAWGAVQSREHITRAIGLMNISYIFAAFDVRHTKVDYIFKQLLSSYEQDVRVYTSKGLDVLTPVLPSPPREERCDYDEADPRHGSAEIERDTIKRKNMPLWAQRALDRLVEASPSAHSSNNTLLAASHVLHFLQRHESLFFPYCSHFVRPLSSYLVTLGFSKEAPDFRKLAIELARVLLTWDKRARGLLDEAEVGSKRARSDDDETRPEYEQRQKQATPTRSAEDTGENRKRMKINYDGKSVDSHAGANQRGVSGNGSGMSAATESSRRSDATVEDMISSFLIQMTLTSSEGSTVGHEFYKERLHKQAQSGQHHHQQQHQQQQVTAEHLYRLSLTCLSELVQVWPAQQPSLDTADFLVRNFASRASAQPQVPNQQPLSQGQGQQQQQQQQQHPQHSTTTLGSSASQMTIGNGASSGSHGSQEKQHQRDTQNALTLAASIDAAAALSSGGAEQARNFRAARNNLSIAKSLLDPTLLASYPSLFPSARNLAARLCSHLEPDEVVVADLAEHVSKALKDINSDAMRHFYRQEMNDSLNRQRILYNQQQQPKQAQSQSQQQHANHQITSQQHVFALTKAKYALFLVRAVTEQEEREGIVDVKRRLVHMVFGELSRATESLLYEVNLNNNKLYARRAAMPTDENSVASSSDVAHSVCECIELCSRFALHMGNEIKAPFMNHLVNALSDKMITASGPVVAKIRSVAVRWASEFADLQQEKREEAATNDGGREGMEHDQNSNTELPYERQRGTIDCESLVRLFFQLLNVHRNNCGDCNNVESEKKVLDALLRLCELGDGVISRRMFDDVERKHLVGLRARDSGQRRRFFALYDEAVGKTPVERLKYVVCEQSWEALSDRFWLKHAVELLFAVLVKDERLQLGPNAAQMAYVPDVSAGEEEALMDADYSTDDLQSNQDVDLDQLVHQQWRFSQSRRGLQVSDLLEQLQNVASCDSNIAAHLWIAMFPVVWSTLQSDEQKGLAKAIPSLLAKEYHAKQSPSRPNVLHTLLEGVSVSQPKPRIPAEVVKYIGKQYNASLLAIPMLEYNLAPSSHASMQSLQQRLQQSQEVQSSGNGNVAKTWEMRGLDALAELYRHLGAEDCAAGLWWCKSSFAGTRRGFTYAIHGFPGKAEETFLSELSKQYSYAPRLEQCVWEQELIKAAKGLEHWDNLSDFAKNANHVDLSLESAFKLSAFGNNGDWHSTWAAIKGKKEVLDGSPGTSSMSAALWLREGNMEEADMQHYLGTSVALQSWWKLPPVITSAHEMQMHSFQQLVEVNEALESLRAMDRSGHNPAKIAREAVQTWNTRFPNQWEPFTWWSSIVSLRSHLRDAMMDKADSLMKQANGEISRLFQEAQQLATTQQQQQHQQQLVALLPKEDQQRFLEFRNRYDDLKRFMSDARTDMCVRSGQRLVAIARKQGEPEMALRLLEQTPRENHPQAQHNTYPIKFMRLTERVKALLAKDNEGSGEDPAAALADLESQNLESFSNANQKAELFRLRGEALHCAGDSDGATQAYVTSVTLHTRLGQAWVNWGEHVDCVGSKAAAESTGTSGSAHANGNAGSETETAQWSEYAATCYLQGARLDAHNFRAQLARVLELLLKPDSNPNEGVAQAIKRQHEYVPAWAWLYHAPHLMYALRRPQIDTAWVILDRLAVHFPQGIYFQLRTSVLDLQSHQSNTPQQQQQQHQHETSDASERHQQYQQHQLQPQVSVSTIAVSHGAAEPTPDEQQQQQQQQQQHVVYSQGSNNHNNATANLSGGSVSGAGAAAAGAGNDGTTSETAAGGLGMDPERAQLPGSQAVFTKLRGMLQHMKSVWYMLLREFESVIPELTGTRFASSIDERMHALFKALVHRALKREPSFRDEVPETLKGELRTVCRSYIQENNLQDSHLRRHANAILTQLQPESDGFPHSLDMLVQVLKQWTNVFDEHLNATHERWYLEQEAPRLCCFRPTELAIPGQLMDDREPPPGVPVRMVALHPEVVALRRCSQVHRRVGMLGEDGRMRSFVIMSLATPTRAEDRLVHFGRHLNNLLDCSNDARKRHLNLHTPPSVPVWPSVRLLEEPENTSAYAEAMENYAARQGQEADTAVLHFKRRIDELIEQKQNAQEDVQQQPAANGYHGQAQHQQHDATHQHAHMQQASRRQALEEMVSQPRSGEPTVFQVPATIFTQHMHRTLPTASHVWALKWQLCSQIALSGLLGYLLQIQARVPNKLQLSKTTGQIYMMDFHPQFDGWGSVDLSSEPVWFRLTRNLTTFFTAYGVYGSLAASVRAAASSLQEPHTASHAHTALLFHDELLIMTPQMRKLVMQSPGMRVLTPLLQSESPPPAKLRELSSLRSKETLDRASELTALPGYDSGARNTSQMEEDATAAESISGETGDDDAHGGVRRQIEPSTDPKRLCNMDPTWQPWF